MRVVAGTHLVARGSSLSADIADYQPLVAAGGAPATQIKNRAHWFSRESSDSVVYLEE